MTSPAARPSTPVPNPRPEAGRGRGTVLGPADEPLAGVIALRGAVGLAAESLGQRIVAGEWPPGAAIPREADLGAALGVSRSVVREAVRILGAKGMVRSRTSDGTRVQPRSEWRLLDPDVMDWRIRAGDTRDLLLELLRVRAVMEPGVVREATLACSDAARARIDRAWSAKVDNFLVDGGDLAARRQGFIEADLEFHRAFLAAVESPLLAQLFNVIEAALRLLFDLQMRARGYESEMIGMEDGHKLHAHVMAAFLDGDAEAAERAMRRLIAKATDDARDGLAQVGLG